MTRTRLILSGLLISCSCAALASGTSEAGLPMDRSYLVLGALTIAGSTLVGLGIGVLTLFMTRREVEARNAEFDRRISSLESAARIDVGELHGKVNLVGREVSALQAETRHQSKLLEQIVDRLQCHPSSV
jgi:hypothetical protein